MTIKYTSKQVNFVLDLVKEDPENFLGLVRKYCPPEREAEVKRSLKAWKINFDEGESEYHSNNRTPRSW